MNEQPIEDLAAFVRDNAPTLHNYDPITKVLLSSTKADLDPLEYKLNGKVVWMYPSSCTQVVPPTVAEGFVAVFDPDAGTWSSALAAAVSGDSEQPPPLELPHQIAALCRGIDADVDAITYAAVGHRTQEYLVAEQEALAFKEAGYEGEPPPSVFDDAEVFQRSARDAADAIIAQGSLWRQAQAIMRRQRLLHKQRAREVGQVEDLAPVLQSWVSTVQTLRTMLEV